jgi:chaperonin cofactor prefoldin
VHLNQFLELQEQTNNYSRDLRQVQGKLVSCQRDVRSNQVTKQHVANYDSDVRLYRGVGKAYVLSSKENVEKKLADEYEMLEKTGRDLMDRKEFLERRIQSNRNNMTDIMNASS